MSEETPLQMAERHVAEGKAQIARQEALIVELVRDQRGTMLPNAELLLQALQQLQQQFEWSLAARWAQAARGRQNRAANGEPLSIQVTE